LGTDPSCLMSVQVSSIEFSLVEKSILLGLQQGNAVLKEIHKEMTVEMVEKLMGETEDAVAYQRVSSLSQQASSGSWSRLSSLRQRLCPWSTSDADLVCSFHPPIFQEIDETLQSKMTAEEEDAVQIELAAMVAEQDAAHKLVSRRRRLVSAVVCLRSHLFLTLQANPTEAVPSVSVPELPSAPTEEPVAPVEEEIGEEPVRQPERQRVLA
jgi:hypothetical protein